MEALKTTYLNQDIEPIYSGASTASVSFDGEILATAVLEDVVVTNLDTNEIIHKIPGDDELITSLVLTPDGSKLAILSQSQQLRIFDLQVGEITKTFKMASPIFMAAADPTSSLFAFGGSDGVVTVWDIEGGFITHSLKGHGTTICSLEFYGNLNSTNWRLASGDVMGTVKVWDLVKRKCITTINEHNSAVRGVGFDETGEFFITGGRDLIAIIYNTNNYKPITTYPIKEQIENAGFLNILDTQYFYTAGSDNILKVWNMKNGQLAYQSKQQLETKEELVIIDVIKMENGDLFLVISDQTLVQLDISNIESEEDQIIPIKRRIAGNHGTIADLRYVGPNFDLIALATNSPSLRIVDPYKPLELKLYEGHTDLLNALDVSNDGRWIATGSKDGEAIIWKYNDETLDFAKYAIFQGHVGSVTAVALARSSETPDFLITGSNDLTIKKWKIPKAEGIVKVSEYTRRAHEKDINSIDIAPNDEYFATASFDKLGKVWNTISGETIGILKGHKRGLWDINFCKFDKLIVTGSGDKTIKVWSLEDFTCKKTFEGHTNSIQRAKFVNKNLQILSTGADGLIKLWDIKQEENLKTFSNHNNRIWAVDIRNDGDEFVSGDADGYLSIWRDNSEEEWKKHQEELKEKVEQEQTLANYISSKDWSNAFLLALTLNHSMRLYNIMKEAIILNEDKESPVGSKKLEETIGGLDNSQLVLLAKKVRDWNVNVKLFEISQKVINVILKSHTVEKLVDIPEFMKILDAIVPYSERHYNRINNLIEQCYILDYAVEEMNKIIA